VPQLSRVDEGKHPYCRRNRFADNRNKAQPRRPCRLGRLGLYVLTNGTSPAVYLLRTNVQAPCHLGDALPPPESPRRSASSPPTSAADGAVQVGPRPANIPLRVIITVKHNNRLMSSASGKITTSEKPLNKGARAPLTPPPWANYRIPARRFHREIGARVCGTAIDWRLAEDVMEHVWPDFRQYSI
jgi:hypothetical protein